MSRENYRDEYRDYENEKTMERETYEESLKEENKEEKSRSSSKKKTADETVKKKVKICKTKLLNVRSSAENAGDDNIVGQLKEDDVIMVNGKENGYYKTNYKGQTAYILSDFCEEV